MKRLIVLTFSLLLLAILLPGQEARAEERTVISQVVAYSNISDILYNTWSVQHPTFTIAEGSPAFLNARNSFAYWWKKDENGNWNAHSGIFSPGTWRYSVQLRIDIDGDDYVLASKPTLEVDDTLWTVNGTSSGTGTTSYVTFFSPEFTVTDQIPIRFAAVTVTAPVAGERPDYSVQLPDDAHYFVGGFTDDIFYNGVSWFDRKTRDYLTPGESTFQSGHRYRVTVELTAKPGYMFIRNSSGTVNLYEADCVYAATGFHADSAASMLRLEYYFPTLPEDPPTIITQPTSKSGAVGSAVTLSLSATGTGLTYQWQYKKKADTEWNDASGKAATWNLTVAEVHYGFDFRCKVTDSNGNYVFSNTVHVDKPAAITTQPTSKTAAVGTSATLSVKATGTGLTYQWQYKKKADTNWSNCSGASAQTANWTVTVAEVHYGFDFRCIVKDAYGKTLYTNKVQINKPGPKITTQPTSKSGAVGSTVTLSLSATGTGLSYQWQYKKKADTTWSNASGKAATWNLTVAEVHYGFDFRCKVTDSNGNYVFSNTVHVDKPAAITAQPTSKTAAVGTSATLSVKATGTGLTYQWQYKKKADTNWSNCSGTSAKTANWTVTVAAVHYGFDFRCMVKDAYGKTLYTNKVQIKQAP